MKIRTLDNSEISDLEGLIPNWKIINFTCLSQELKFDNFRNGLEFVNIVGDLAEVLDHHPEIHLTYSTVSIFLTTHSIKGLSELDVELARRIDNSYLKFSELKG